MIAKCPPHTFRGSLAPFPMSLPLPPPTFGWLLCPHIEWQPRMAMAPSPSLLYFANYFDDQTDDMASPPTRSAMVTHPPQYPLHCPG